MTSSPEHDPGHDIHAALTYATHDGVALQGDLYLPKGAGPFPALVAVHGGGWQQGARSQFQYWGPYLASRGYGLLAISYRLAKKGTKALPTPCMTWSRPCGSCVPTRRNFGSMPGALPCSVPRRARILRRSR